MASITTNLAVPQTRRESDVQASVKAMSSINQSGDLQPTAPVQPKTFFESIALPLVKRVGQVIPLYPKSKSPHAQLVPAPLEDMSADPEQIHAWGAAEPDANVGVYARQVPGGLLFLDKDGAISLREKYQAETGNAFPRTLLVRSSVIQKGGKKISKGHWYFRQTLKTMALPANIPEDKTDGLFSLRVNNELVCSIGSIHPVTGMPYEVAEEYPIAEMPDQLLEWLLAQVKESTAETAVNPSGVLIPHGQIHPWLVRKAGELRASGLNSEEIEPVLIRFAHETCAPPLDESKIIAIARSIGKYPTPSNKPIYVDGKIPAVVETESVDVGEETGIEDIEEKLPEFPHFSGLLSELCEVICPDIPYEFKMMAAVTHWGLMRSGLDSLDSDPNLQPRFYACLIALPGMGKSAAINEIRQILPSLNSNYIIAKSVDSGPALVDEFVDRGKQMTIRNTGDSLSRVLLDPDEMTDLFEKSKMTAQSRNSLSTELLGLYESNRTANRSRKAGKSQVDNAMLAILAGATPEGYEGMWTGTGGGSTGLQSRFVPISTAAGKMQIERRLTNLDALKFYVDELISLANRPGQVVSLDPDAKKMLRDWWGTDRSKPSESRVDDMVKRLLIVLATTNDVLVIGPDLMGQAIKFGDYVIAAREKYNPSDSHSWTQAFEQAIIKVGQKHKVAMTMREYRQFVQPNRRPGGFGAFLQAWKTLIQAGVLKADGTTRVGTAKYRVAN